MRSMKAMASLAPQLNALQAKYADDRQRLQLEMNALYKENGVNPVAGCLPILVNALFGPAFQKQVAAT